MTMDINVTTNDNMKTNNTNTPGIGMRLKEARESMRLTEKDAAGRLHLNVKFIYAMENEDFENGPPATFLRGYLRSYARLLCIPENEIEAALKQLGVAAPTNLGATTTSLNIPMTNQNEPYMRWLTYLVVLVLLVLVGMWWTSHSSRDVEFNKTMAQVPAQTEVTSTTNNQNNATPHTSTTTITVTKHDSAEPAQLTTQKSITTQAPAQTTVIVNTNPPLPSSTPEVTTEVTKPATTTAVPTSTPENSVIANPDAVKTVPTNTATTTTPVVPTTAATTTTPAAPATAAPITAPVPQPSVAPNAMIPAQTNNAAPPGAPMAAGNPALNTTTPDQHPAMDDKSKHRRHHHRSNNYMQMELPEPGLYY